MARRTSRASRKLSKNLKRNTIKRKRMKRNNSKKKTKRTKGGFWGRCHNQWEKLIDREGIENMKHIYRVTGNPRYSMYDIIFYDSRIDEEILIQNIRISEMKKIDNIISNKLKDALQNVEVKVDDYNVTATTFTFTHVFRGSEENCIKRFKEVNAFFELIERAINSAGAFYPDNSIDRLEQRKVILETLFDYRPKKVKGNTYITLNELELELPSPEYLERFVALRMKLNEWYNRVEYSKLTREKVRKSVIIQTLETKFPRSKYVENVNLHEKKKKYIVGLFRKLYMYPVCNDSRLWGPDYERKCDELSNWFDQL